MVNIPKDAVGNGQTVLEYKAPAPPRGTDYHRYIFLLFAQARDTIQVGTCAIAKFMYASCYSGATRVKQRLTYEAAYMPSVVALMHQVDLLRATYFVVLAI